MSEFQLAQHPIVLMRPRVSFPYGWVGHIPFAYLAIDLLRPRRFVELGTDSGNSYLAFCQAVQHSSAPTQCTAIDSWQGDEHARRYGDEIYTGLRARHDPAYGGFSRLLRARFDDALAQFDDASIDLLHIDGLHTYDAVRHDFESWLPKLSERAVVLLHDTNVREREFGVWKFFAELAQRHPSFAFEHSNGLGIVAVGHEIPAAFRAFMDAAQAAPAVYRAFFESLAGTLIDARDQLPLAGVQLDASASAHLYYRRADEAFDEARMISQALPATAGTLDLRFALPAGAAIDFLRIDPADLPGVFEIVAITLSGDGDAATPLEDLPRRIGRVNGDLLAPVEGRGLRLATFGEDPYIEFEVGDVFGKLAGAAGVEVVIRVDYEAVVADPAARHLLLAQADALSGIRAIAAHHIDIRALVRGFADDQRAARALHERLHAEASASLGAWSRNEDRLHARLDRERAELQLQMQTLQHDLRADGEAQTEALQGDFARLRELLTAHIGQAAAAAQSQVEHLQQIEARLNRLEQRSVWSWFRAERG